MSGRTYAAVIVSDEGRFWMVSRNGSTKQICNLPTQPGRPSQEDRYATRLARGPSPGDHRYELPPRERWQRKTIHIPPLAVSP